MAVCLAVFASSLTYPFLEGMDDNVYVTRNVDRLRWNWANIAHWLSRPYLGSYLPLTMISYMVDHAIWGLNPLGYHLQNLLWHTVAVLGVYACFIQLGVRRSVAFCVCLLFAVHPQRVESVVWISERKDVLCAACYWWSIWAYLRVGAEKRFPAVAFILFVLAMVAKPMAISLPVVLALVEIHRSRRFSVRDLAKRLWPFLAVAAVAVPITMLGHSIPSDQTTFGRQLMVAIWNVIWYASKTAWPGALSPIYPKVSLTPLLVGGMVLAYVALGVGAVLAWRRWPYNVAYFAAPLAVAYLASAAPTLGFVPLGYIDHADRYSYIPCVFLWLGVAGLISHWGRSSGRHVATMRNWAPAVVGIVGVLCGWLSVRHAMAWRDIGALHRTAAQHTPPSHFALGTLGDIQVAQGDWEGVFATAERLGTLDQPWMTPDHRVAKRNKAQSLRATALYRTGRQDEALRLFEEVLGRRENTAFRVQIDLPVMLAMMADCYLGLDARVEVMRCYDELVGILPESNYEGCFYRGVRAHYLQDYETALRWFEEADRLVPDLAQVRANIADCRKRLAGAD